MKLSSFSLIVLAISIFFLPLAKIEAHTLETDGSISAIFHIEPNHVAVVGLPAPIDIEFQDKQNKLNLKLCDCTITIINSGSPIYTATLGQDPKIEFAEKSIHFTYTFPTTDPYQLIVEGKPAATGNFQSFKLSYEVIVVNSATSTAAAAAAAEHEGHSLSEHFLAGHGLHILFFGAAILISLYIIIRDILGRRPRTL